MLPQQNPHSIENDLMAAMAGDLSARCQFDTLALQIFSHQYQNNLPYQRYCHSLESLGKSPENVTRWQDIPTVPTDAFKLHAHPLISFPANHIQHTFHTSGTTTETKGHHHFPSLALYEQSILSGWKQAKLPTPQNAIFLTPSPADAPHSSLSHMMGVLSTEFAQTSNWIIHNNGSIQFEKITPEQPVALLGTALAFLHLFEQLPDSIHLPKGSWAMETGGYKGIQRSLSKENLYQLFQSKLGLPPESVINEYSMTELSSQFYTHGLENPHHGPRWTRIRVINPETGTEAARGQPGHLAIYDLANLHSAMAIQTQDVAIAHSDNSFTLLGRDPSALPRGCSRSADDTLQTP
jgi:hypothetical protein